MLCWVRCWLGSGWVGLGWVDLCVGYGISHIKGHAWLPWENSPVLNVINLALKTFRKVSYECVASCAAELLSHVPCLCFFLSLSLCVCVCFCVYLLYLVWRPLDDFLLPVFWANLHYIWYVCVLCFVESLRYNFAAPGKGRPSMNCDFTGIFGYACPRLTIIKWSINIIIIMIIIMIFHSGKTKARVLAIKLTIRNAS